MIFDDLLLSMNDGNFFLVRHLKFGRRIFLRMTMRIVLKKKVNNIFRFRYMQTCEIVHIFLGHLTDDYYCYVLGGIYADGVLKSRLN